MSLETEIPAQALKIDSEMRQVWENIPLRQRAQDTTYAVTQQVVDRYLDAVGRQDVAAGTGDWAPPDLFCGDYAPLTIGFGQTIGFHASHHIRSHRPLAVGGKVHASGKVTDKFQRRGFRYYTLSFEHRDDAGRLLVEHATTIAVGVLRDPNYRPEPKAAEPRPAATPEKVFERVGTIGFTQERMGDFAEQGALRWGWDYIGGGSHTDVEFAQSAGLARTNAQSLHYYGWLAQYLAARWGKQWWSLGNLEMKFIGQVGPGDRLVAEWLEEEGGLSVRIRNEQTRGMVSTGRAWLSPAADASA